jgi:hypothetical protein
MGVYTNQKASKGDSAPAVPIDRKKSSDEPSVSDFVEIEGPGITKPGYQRPAPTEGQTCADCVYEETCPNKETSNPSNCGSFQWR